MANRMEWPADSGRLETVERATLQEQIYRQLRDRIMSGFFQPGQALSTRSVAEAVGVSVMPVRDALRRLEVENALVVGHNRALEIPRLDIETLGEISATRTALLGRVRTSSRSVFFSYSWRASPTTKASVMKPT